MAKNDDAEVKVGEWNERVCNGLGINYCPTIHDKALDVLRKLLMVRYRSYRFGVIGSFRRYMKEKYGTEWLRDMRTSRKRRRGAIKEIVLAYDVGMDAIRRSLAASFWEWDDGSTVLFWRWPREFQNQMRDGMQVWYRERDLPNYWGRQRWPEDTGQRKQLEEKLLKVVDRRYIVPGYVKSFTSFFPVLKGTEDIRVVYDATRSGLNAAIWSPNFMLPTATDIDLGEMFLNYFLDKRLRPLAGVDLGASLELGESHIQKPTSNRLIMRWERSLMGVKSSPFNCVRAYLWSEDVIKGEHLESNNPFRWDRVVFNLPGTVNYDPRKPWLYKYDDLNAKLAAFVISYVDDLRTGDEGGKERCDRVTHHVASLLNYLGEQDAARKRGSASQQPGARAGSVIESKKAEGLFVTISQEKWVKVKLILEFYKDKVKTAAGDDEIFIEYKRLEQDTGFLVHVCMTYENLRPYLKGFYLTMNEWRFDRDKEGWKLDVKYWKEVAEDWMDGDWHWETARHAAKCKAGLGGEAPSQVRMVPQMIQDVEVLSMLFGHECPAKRLIHGVSLARVLYGFADASGAGFGASWEMVEGGKSEVGRKQEDSISVRYRFGRWGSESEGTSSNYRELRNLVESLEEMGMNGELSGVEVFLFTDNSTAEAACNRGSSSSKSLFDLVKRFKMMEMIFRTRIHVIHVSGKRMIAQGADGLSRGCLSEGVMRGERMEAFIPLHKSAADRSAPGIVTWLQELCSDSKGTPFKLLTPEDWYVLGQDITGGTRNCDNVWIPTYNSGSYVWAPPPCVAQQCLEELRRARHKRQVSSHIFVCPRIMTAAWRRRRFGYSTGT